MSSRTAVVPGTLVANDVPRWNGTAWTAANLAGGMTLYDTFANRPSAGTAGRVFIPSDNGFSQIDTGAEWMNLVRGIPFSEPVETADISTQTSFGTSTLTKTAGVVIFNVQRASSEQIRLSGALITAPTNCSVTMGMDPIIGSVFGSTSQKLANMNGGVGIYIRRTATNRTLAFMLKLYGANDNSSPHITFDYWTGTTTLSGQESTRKPIQHHLDSGAPTLYRLRHTTVGSVFADISADRGNTWTQIYQDSSWLDGIPDEFGVVGWSNSTASDPSIVGRYWHLGLVGN